MAQWLTPAVLEAGGAAVVGLVYAAAAGAGDKRAAVEALLALRAGAAREAMARPIMVMLSTDWFTRLGALDLAYELETPRFQTYVTRLGLMEYWKQYGPPDDCELKDGKLTCH